jgi:hypothetical protein
MNTAQHSTREGAMKSLLKAMVAPLARNDITWFLLMPFAKVGAYLDYFRKSVTPEAKPRHPEMELRFSRQPQVESGPFKGMKYPRLDSVWGNIYPKLLGCYEKELWDTIENIVINGYSEIIDIGCSDGFYAVGLAMRMPAAKVYAYDINDKALEFCREMAILNGVEDRVILKSQCSADALSAFRFTGKGLIICDCEGFEKELFNGQSAGNLACCDLLIETHDFLDITISTNLKAVFKDTHHIHSIKSVDDIEKALTYDIKGMEKIGLPEKKKILAEERPAIMEWLVCKSKAS